MYLNRREGGEIQDSKSQWQFFGHKEAQKTQEKVEFRLIPFLRLLYLFAAKAPGLSSLFLRISCFLPLFSLGCRQEMADQPRVDTYKPASFFKDRASIRPQIPGTVAQGEPVAGSASNPEPLSLAQLKQGQTQYHINCRHCHGPAGYGDGIVVQRGFPRPPSYHSDRLREVSDSRIFEVITQGHGRMPAFERLVDVNDRWSIVAYVRALQLSQHAVVKSDLTTEERLKLTKLPAQGPAE